MHIREVHFRDQPDDAAVEISLTQIVVSERLPDLSHAISRILLSPRKASPYCAYASIIDHRAAPIAARIVNICFRDARIDFITDRGVVLRPGRGGPFLAHAAGPDLAQRRQALLPASAVVFLVNRAVRRRQHTRAITGHAVLRGHLRRHTVDAGPVLRRHTDCSSKRGTSLAGVS